MKNSLPLVCLASVTAFIGCSSTDITTPPRQVIVVEPPVALNPPSHVFNYDQQVQRNKQIFDESKARKFIADFSSLFLAADHPVPTFSFRINPDADGRPLAQTALADQQAASEIERYFARPLRDGGIRLVDERRVHEGGAHVRPDYAVNVLASARTFTIPGLSGQIETKSVPDVQVTVIRTADSSIVGQASTVDIIGNGRDSWVTVERVGVPELMRATALVLLEDMVTRHLSKEIADMELAKKEFVSELPKRSQSETPIQVTKPEPSRPIQSIDWTQYSLINDRAREEARKLDQQISKVNQNAEEIEAWKLGLLSDEQIKALKDSAPPSPSQLVVKKASRRFLELTVRQTP